MVKRIYNSLGLRLLLVVGLSIAIGYAFWERDWIVASCCAAGLAIVIISVHLLYKRNARKVAFLFDAIDNNDYSFKYAIEGHSSDDKLVNESLNRITRMLFQAKAEAIQREKYYELIMNQVNTGIIVEDDKGNIVQTNREATRLLGLTIFTHVRQLSRIDEAVERLFEEARAGEKHQISFTNERGTVHLSVRVSEMTLREKHVRILAINDINSELDDKEIESWIRLTRVLTHEIMNSITPITSLSDTLLTTRPDADAEIRTGLEVISATGKNLMSFVESYHPYATTYFILRAGFLGANGSIGLSPKQLPWHRCPDRGGAGRFNRIRGRGLDFTSGIKPFEKRHTSHRHRAEGWPHPNQGLLRPNGGRHYRGVQQWPGYPARGGGTHFRAFLHHERERKRHRPFHLPANHAALRR